jgi:hypothetical protein
MPYRSFASFSADPPHQVSPAHSRRMTQPSSLSDLEAAVGDTALSTRWGWERTGRRRKVVWAELAG